MDGRTDGTDRQKYRRWMDGWMNEQMDEWMNG